MVKACRISNNNIFYFMKEHPDLKLELEKGKVVNVVFPENSTNNTLVLLDGKIVFLQYATSDSGISNFNTYDSSEDFSYEENIKKLIHELSD